jgi:hypothetical protein
MLALRALTVSIVAAELCRRCFGFGFQDPLMLCWTGEARQEYYLLVKSWRSCTVMFCQARQCPKRQSSRCLCTKSVAVVDVVMRTESVAIEGLMSRYNRSMVIRRTDLLFISEGLAEELAVVGRRGQSRSPHRRHPLFISQ